MMKGNKPKNIKTESNTDYNHNLCLNILTEETIVASNGIYVSVTGSGSTIQNYADDPYIKLYSVQNPFVDGAPRGTTKKGVKMVRISIKDPSFIVHEKDSERSNWVPSNSTLKKLDKLLSTPGNWKKVVDCVNKQIQREKPGTPYQNFEKPDFKSVKSSKDKE